MSMLAHFDPIDGLPAERRGARRLQVSLGSELGSLGSTVLIQDLSTNGLLIVATADLDVGDTIELHLPEAGFTSAKVVRRDGPYTFGCQFNEPIPKAAVSAALLQSNRPTGIPTRPARQGVRLQASSNAGSMHFLSAWLDRLAKQLRPTRRL